MAEISPAGIAGPYYVAAQQLYQPGAQTAQMKIPGSVASQLYKPGPRSAQMKIPGIVAGQIFTPGAKKGQV